jgi:putrescine transport system permease protein
MVGRVLWTEFFSNRDWPLAAALAIGLLVLILIPALAMFRLTHREERA